MQKSFLYKYSLLLSVSLFILITKTSDEKNLISSSPLNPQEQSYVVMNFYINQDGLIDQTFNTDQHDVSISTSIKIKDFLERTSLLDFLKSYYTWGVVGIIILFIFKKKLLSYVKNKFLEKACTVIAS